MKAHTGKYPHQGRGVCVRVCPWGEERGGGEGVMMDVLMRALGPTSTCTHMSMSMQHGDDDG